MAVDDPLDLSASTALLKHCLLPGSGVQFVLIGCQEGKELLQPVTSVYLFGGVSLSLGIGYLISAGISYRLSRAWGLLAGTGLGKP